MEKHALVVDASSDMRELIRSILLSQQYVVDAVADPGEVAPEHARRYALVVADVPFGEAMAHCAHRIHTRFPTVGPRLVLMSADREDPMDAPADSELLLKPFDRASFVTAVKQVTAK